MEIKLINWKYEKINKGEVTLNLPNEIIYFFVGGLRVICKVEPLFKYDKSGLTNEISGYKFNALHNQFKTTFESFTVSLGGMEEVYYSTSKNRVTENDDLVRDFMNASYYERTKEQYETEINNFKNTL